MYGMLQEHESLRNLKYVRGQHDHACHARTGIAFNSTEVCSAKAASSLASMRQTCTQSRQAFSGECAKIKRPCIIVGLMLCS